MAAIIQYEFNNDNQWMNAGEPKLINTASHITVLGFSETTGKYHVEALFADVDDVPTNGLLAAKSVDPVPHHFLGYETLAEYEQRKQEENEA